MPRWPARTVAQRFWAHVDRSAGPDACWPWRGSINPNGYGHFRLKLDERWTVARAHRVALVLGFPGVAEPRPLDEGAEALHRNSCERICCNPSHLRSGTRTENNHDVAAKKRERQPVYLKPGRELRLL